MRVLDCEQNSPEWLAARCGIATASEFATVLSKGKENAEAVGRKNYRRRLVVERLTGRPLEGGFSSKSTEQGHEREPGALDAWMVKKGLLVQRAGFVRHDEIECGASPDALAEDEDGPGGVEVKSPELSAHMDYLLRPDAPPAYRAQIQGNLWLTGRKWWDFVSWNPDFPAHLQLVVRRVLPDEKYIQQLEFMVHAFMEEVRTEEAEMRALPEAA